ncbi:hypothetical protein [Lentzea sp. NPDC092896]|uniref:hypothetical protein n=1 Tax=Lentzea sp. NPDC092896 TaxID=3364127 RepID=UPI003815D5B7
MTESSSLLTVITAVALFVWWYRTRDHHPQQAPETQRGLRNLDYIPVICDDPGHHPDRIPTAPIRAHHAGLDIADMYHGGWGSTEHLQLCHFHNQGRYPLDVVHVLCGQDGCSTRATIPTDDPAVGIGELRYRGWRNDRQVPVCPYCSGTRSRTWR